MADRSARKRKAASAESPTAAKLQKTETSDTNDVDLATGNVMEFYAEKRIAALPKDGKEFKFNKKRVRMISKIEELQANCNGIVYWMFRDQRVEGLYFFIYD